VGPRNDNIQNVDYLCQNCGKNCDSKSSAVQCDACDIWVHNKCESLDIKFIEEIENNFNCEYICCSCQALVLCVVLLFIGCICFELCVFTNVSLSCVRSVLWLVPEHIGLYTQSQVQCSAMRVTYGCTINVKD
jgi:hypothetical protein